MKALLNRFRRNSNDALETTTLHVSLNFHFSQVADDTGTIKLIYRALGNNSIRLPFSPNMTDHTI